MQDFQIVDVTLRDGGYRTNFHFEDYQLSNILTCLDQSGIEYIEIGYKNGSIHQINDIGITGICDKNYIEKCRNLVKKAKIVVMLHAKNVTLDDIHELSDFGVDLVRICIQKKGYEDSYRFVEIAKKNKLEVSINITRMSQYSEEELDHIVSVCCNLDIDMIYFADSNGSMLPSKIENIYKKYNQMYKMSFGFHAHDNLGMAQANALAALAGGAHYIDASLMGIGKGVGNLKILEFISYLHAIKINKYNINILVWLSNFIRRTIVSSNKDVSINELMMGISDLSIDDVMKLQTSSL